MTNYEMYSLNGPMCLLDLTNVIQHHSKQLFCILVLGLLTQHTFFSDVSSIFSSFVLWRVIVFTFYIASPINSFYKMIWQNLKKVGEDTSCLLTQSLDISSHFMMLYFLIRKDCLL